ncbi:hypothetical protein INT45_013340 [Circinella minor]|uniref:Uncharacterized protein n=1 Tax=Circinella minor TaxID=1195481 RepID=A0A8H7RWM8_9FUNG|nr:hypothetical protein INT45_013340 [Circinella minor]
MEVFYQLHRVPSLKLLTDSKIIPTTTPWREPRLEWNPKLEYMQKWKEWSTMDHGTIQAPSMDQTTTIHTTPMSTELSKDMTKTTTTLRIDQEENDLYHTNYTIIHNQRQSNMDMENPSVQPTTTTTTTNMSNTTPSPLLSVTSLTSPQLLPLSLNNTQENRIEQENQLQEISQQQHPHKNDSRMDSHSKQNNQNNRSSPEHTMLSSSEPLLSTTSTPRIHHEIIFTRATPYQQEQCQRAIEIATTTANTHHHHHHHHHIIRNEFEKLLNILNHPDSEIIQDNLDEVSTNDYDRIKRSGKTFLLFELLRRITSLNQSNRPSIDIVIILDIRILPTHTLFSKLEGQRRALWIITKSTVEERAFDILCQSMVNKNHWMDIWESNENLRNTMYNVNLGIGLDNMEEMVRKSITRAMLFLFRSVSLWGPKSGHSSDTLQQQQQKPSLTKRSRLNIPVSSIALSTCSSSTLQDITTTSLNKQKRTIRSPYFMNSDNDDDKNEEPVTPVPEKVVKTIKNNTNTTMKDVENSTIDLNQFGKRVVHTIDQLLEYPQTLHMKRKYKEISKTTRLSREFKETLNETENTLYTQTIQSRLETIESSFQNEYQQYMKDLQSKYLDDMAAIQQKYKEEAIHVLDTAIINHSSK